MMDREHRLRPWQQSTLTDDPRWQYLLIRSLRLAHREYLLDHLTEKRLADPCFLQLTGRWVDRYHLALGKTLGIGYSLDMERMRHLRSAIEDTHVAHHDKFVVFLELLGPIFRPLKEYKLKESARLIADRDLCSLGVTLDLGLDVRYSPTNGDASPQILHGLIERHDLTRIDVAARIVSHEVVKALDPGRGQSLGSLRTYAFDKL